MEITCSNHDEHFYLVRYGLYASVVASEYLAFVSQPPRRFSYPYRLPGLFERFLCRLEQMQMLHRCSQSDVLLDLQEFQSFSERFLDLLIGSCLDVDDIIAYVFIWDFCVAYVDQEIRMQFLHLMQCEITGTIARVSGDEYFGSARVLELLSESCGLRFESFR